MVLEGGNCEVMIKLGSNGLQRGQKSYQMVLKGANWVHNDKSRSNGLERSQLGTQC